MAQQIKIPPAVDVTLLPSNVQFYFTLTSPCQVCFGPSNPPSAFPQLSNQTFPNWGAQSPLFNIPPSAVPEPYITYSTSGLNTPCLLTDPTQAVKTIHVGQNFTKPRPGKKGKKPAKKKAAVKKAAAKPAKKKKPARKAAKKAAKKLVKKSAKKAGKSPARKAAKKKSAKKSRR
jgi:hypothetical protein